MAAPLARDTVRIEIEGEQVSKPYLAITVHLMAQFGVEVQHDNYERFEISPSTYRSPDTLLVEGDASSASYFLAAGAIAGDGVTVFGVGEESVQGDVAFVDVLEAMGALRAARTGQHHRSARPPAGCGSGSECHSRCGHDRRGAGPVR